MVRPFSVSTGRWNQQLLGLFMPENLVEHKGSGKRRILISLVSRQTMPNYLGFRLVEPDVMVYLYTEEEKSALNHLKKVIHTKERLFEVDAYDPETVRDSIRRICEEETENELFLNLTGGTKIMALAAFEAFRECEGGSFYINTESNGVIWFGDAKIKKETLKECEDCGVYLRLYGHEILDEDKPKNLDLAREIGEHFDKYMALLEILKKLGAGNILQNIALAKEAREFMVRIGGFVYDAGKREIQIRDRSILNYLMGGWLEEYVYDMLKKRGFRDVRLGVRLKGYGQGNAKQEIDVLGLWKNRLFLFECKTGKWNQYSVHRIEALREIVGGTFGVGFIVYGGRGSEELLARTRDYRELRLVRVEELEHVLDEIQGRK